MIISQLNYLAVAVSAVAYFMLGAIWFNEKVFGTAWAKGHNISRENPDRSGMGKMMSMTVVTCFVIAIACGYMIAIAGSNNVMSGLKLGLVIGVGFAACTYYINSLYTRRSFSLVMIDSGYHVVGISICTIILSIWK